MGSHFKVLANLIKKKKDFILICVSFMADETAQKLTHLLAVCISFPFTLLFVLRTLFSYQIVHHFLIGYELFVNQHQSAPFLLCVLQIFFRPFCCLLFDCIYMYIYTIFFFFFASQMFYIFFQSHFSIHLFMVSGPPGGFRAVLLLVSRLLCVAQ